MYIIVILNQFARGTCHGLNQTVRKLLNKFHRFFFYINPLDFGIGQRYGWMWIIFVLNWKLEFVGRFEFLTWCSVPVSDFARIGCGNLFVNRLFESLINESPVTIIVDEVIQRNQKDSDLFFYLKALCTIVHGWT